MAKHRLTRAEYERGLPGYHDPTAGIGGAAPELSALTARLWLAGFGLLFCTVAAVLTGLAGWAVLTAALAVPAAVALVEPRLGGAPQAPRRARLSAAATRRVRRGVSRVGPRA
jgi:hypothetical protein